jgi:hypothetical protein
MMNISKQAGRPCSVLGGRTGSVLLKVDGGWIRALLISSGDPHTLFKDRYCPEALLLECYELIRPDNREIVVISSSVNPFFIVIRTTTQP